MQTKKVHHYAYYVIAAACLIFLLFQRKLFLTLILLGVCAFIQYLTHAREIKIDAGHVFFFAVILSRIDGIAVGISFIILAGSLPRAVLGDIDETFFVTYPIQILAVLLAGFLGMIGILLLGILMTLLAYLAIFLIASQMLEVPMLEVIDDIGIPFVVDVILFLSFSTFVFSFLKAVL